MNIIFSNNKVFEYTEAFAIERDFYNGETRQSIEVHLPIAQTSYDEIDCIVNDETMTSFVLVGEKVTLENGDEYVPTNTYEGYVLGDKITVEKGMLIFKKYKASEVEMENAELKTAVDTLLIAMEV